jgi:hypothetical protein
VAAADVRVFGLPSTVWETVPAAGPDLLAFTPAPDANLGIWTVSGDGSHGPGHVLVADDGISIAGVGAGSGAMAILGEDGDRRYLRVGGAGDGGSGYWLAVGSVLGGATLREMEPNDEVGSAEGLGPPGSSAAVLASIDGPGDVDVFELPAIGSPACFEAVSARFAAHPLAGPFLALAVLDDAGIEIDRVQGGAGPWDADPVACTDGSGEAAFVRVEALAGTTGPYLMMPRPPVIVSEIDPGVAAGPFVEVSGRPGSSLSGFAIEMLDGSSGAVLGTVDLTPLGVMPATGFLVAASPGSVAGADVEDAALDLMVAPFAVRVCGPGGSCDSVQAGGVPGHGEGSAVLDPAMMPAARLWGIDTDRNEWDFFQMAFPTPGEPNSLPAP